VDEAKRLRGRGYADLERALDALRARKAGG
jgi:hypothetical protein